MDKPAEEYLELEELKLNRARVAALMANTERLLREYGDMVSVINAKARARKKHEEGDDV